MKLRRYIGGEVLEVLRNLKTCLDCEIPEFDYGLDTWATADFRDLVKELPLDKNLIYQTVDLDDTYTVRLGPGHYIDVFRVSDGSAAMIEHRKDLDIFIHKSQPWLRKFLEKL